MKTLVMSAGSVALLIVSLTGTSAFAQDSKWIIRGMPSYLSTASDNSPVTATLPPPLGQETTSQNIEGAAGFGFGVEYMWNERFGIEIAAFVSPHDSVGEANSPHRQLKMTQPTRCDGQSTALPVPPGTRTERRTQSFLQ